MTQLVHPDGEFEDSVSAASSIAPQIGGQLSGVVFLPGLMLVQFASGLAAQASASIRLYAMGHDSVLPEAVFGIFQGHRQAWTEVGDGADRRFEPGVHGRCRETGRQ